MSPYHIGLICVASGVWWMDQHALAFVVYGLGLMAAEFLTPSKD